MISNDFNAFIQRIDAEFSKDTPYKIFVPEVEYINGQWEYGEKPVVGTESLITLL